MAPQTSVHRVKKPKAKWSITVMMNAKDLSRDDDFLRFVFQCKRLIFVLKRVIFPSHILVEHLGTDGAPLQVHKMDPSWTAPKHDPKAVMTILKKVCSFYGTQWCLNLLYVNTSISFDKEAPPTRPNALNALLMPC